MLEDASTAITVPWGSRSNSLAVSRPVPHPASRTVSFPCSERRPSTSRPHSNCGLETRWYAAPSQSFLVISNQFSAKARRAVGKWNSPVRGLGRTVPSANAGIAARLSAKAARAFAVDSAEVRVRQGLGMGTTAASWESGQNADRELAPATPMMRQYLEIKALHPDTILFFRLGDFYEMFFEDAVKGSELLQITLTSRSKGDERVPMCGVPYHSARRYIAKLIESGLKVAICDQMEEAGNGPGIVKREVTRIITPGTVLDEDALEPRVNNFLASIVPSGGAFGSALLDPSTGELSSFECESLFELKERLGPGTGCFPDPSAFADLDRPRRVRPCARGSVSQVALSGRVARRIWPRPSPAGGRGRRRCAPLPQEYPEDRCPPRGSDPVQPSGGRAGVG